MAHVSEGRASSRAFEYIAVVTVVGGISSFLGYSAWAVAVMCFVAATVVAIITGTEPAKPSTSRSHSRSRQEQQQSWDEDSDAEDEYESCGPFSNMSKRERKRYQQSQQRFEKSRLGRKVYEVTGFVMEDRYQGKMYCATTMGCIFTYNLPRNFQIAEREWKVLVAEADRSEIWRRTRDPEALSQALAEIVAKKIMQRQNQQQKQQHKGKKQQGQQSRQAQWDQQQTRDSRRKPAHPASHVPLSGKYVSAAAEQPDLSSMSVAQLQTFIQQTGSALKEQANSCTDQSELLSLAQRSMQLWECKRIISCSSLPHNNTEQELLAALCVLRLQTGQGPRQPAAAAHAATASELKKRYQRLALQIHPDKVLSEHQEQLSQFDDAFKVLGKAQALISTYCASG